MKALLTLALLENYDNPPEAPCGDAQVICLSEGRTAFKNFIKGAEGKYTVFLDRDFSFGDIYPFISALDKTSADAVRFVGGRCFKTSLLKTLNVPESFSRFDAEFAAAAASKSLAAVKAEPFEFPCKCGKYDRGDDNGIFSAMEQFKKYKGKLKTEIYSFVFDLICGKIFEHFALSLAAVYKKTETAEYAAEFDRRLKEDIVVALAVEKRFKDAGIEISKLRKKQFKIPYMTYLKLKKLI